MRENDDRQVGPVLAERIDQLRPAGGVPAPEDRGPDFASMRPLEKGDGLLPIRSADDAPAGARGDRGDQAALVGVGVEKQERACRFFAQFRPFAREPTREPVKGDLRDAIHRAWGVRRGLLWTCLYRGRT